jgi:diaminopimelate decarboxylase
MIKNGMVTEAVNFFEGADPFTLINTFASPLYVYNERILRNACRALKNMCGFPKFKINYSVKANASLALLQIIRSEGLCVDALSSGEIFTELHAGFTAEQILFVANNISEPEMQYAIDRGILISVDSVSQLRQYGKLNPGGSVAVRFNPGIGDGHHEKVITAGKNTKFGVNPEYIPEVKDILRQFSLKLVGINQHIGSQFLEKTQFIQSALCILDFAKEFRELEFIDLGGGLGIPYHKLDGQAPMDLADCGAMLTDIMEQFSKSYGREITFIIEPGRYVAAECGLLLGTVHSIKTNDNVKYIGTDLGFNVLQRPILYDSHHDIEVYSHNQNLDKPEAVTIVGNICESGDVLAKNRWLPEIFEGDILGILDTGAYGYSMCSNYNNRLRPAEVLLRENGDVCLIRSRDTYEDLIRNQSEFSL